MNAHLNGTGRLVIAMLLLTVGSAAIAQTERYVRYDAGDGPTYGMERGDTILALDEAPWLGGRPTGVTVDADDATLLAPVEPRKVFAVGYNYLSHRGDRELPEHPPIFLKLPTSITGPDTDVIYPDDATDLHYEAEMVVVIGRRARHVTPDEAAAYVFGVTAGDDVSERAWQANDLQWFRAKASDTFGPVGPAIVTGLEYNVLLVESRLNGELKQSQRTRDFIHDVEAIISHISQSATLEPGDVIFTGTPGSTTAMKPGDVIEISVEGVGTLRNRIVRDDAGNN
jgi:2-keto-4-pentenoate hydratase/2-oxohepta-3-ene-1,7-dioic acid hydratase in catechol pathway